MIDIILEVGRMLGEIWTLEEGAPIHGIIDRSMPAEIHGVKGFLVWDYILYNEITFDYMDETKYYSLFKSWSDEKTELKWNELVSKYGV